MILTGRPEMPRQFYDDVYGKGNYGDNELCQALWEHLRGLVDYSKTILDLGCGTGALANNSPKYTGIDFSEEAIKTAREQNPDSKFICAGLFEALWPPAELYIATEVLEHIGDDLSLLKAIPDGSQVILSVPPYDSAAHVRYFFNLGDAQRRYKHCLSGVWHEFRGLFIFEGERKDR